MNNKPKSRGIKEQLEVILNEHYWDFSEQNRNNMYWITQIAARRGYNCTGKRQQIEAILQQKKMNMNDIEKVYLSKVLSFNEERKQKEITRRQREIKRKGDISLSIGGRELELGYGYQNDLANLSLAYKDSIADEDKAFVDKFASIMSSRKTYDKRMIELNSFIESQEKITSTQREYITNALEITRRHLMVQKRRGKEIVNMEGVLFQMRNLEIQANQIARDYQLQKWNKIHQEKELEKSIFEKAYEKASKVLSAGYSTIKEASQAFGSLFGYGLEPATR